MKNKITIIEGDGIGPEIMSATLKILKALELPLVFDTVLAGKVALEASGDLLPPETIESIKTNKIVLKGPIETPIGFGFKSINVTLRQMFDLYSNIRHVKNDAIDLVIFRENTEGLYIGEEHDIDDKTVHAIKKVTYDGCYRIIEAAFEYALKHGRKKVTLVHKANILKKADGMFLRIGQSLSKKYPSIIFEDVIVDNMCMQLVMRPEQYDVIVAQNLYGDILSDLCAGLVGGLGLVPGANIGEDIMIFEPVHGTAPDIAGKNMANPIALLRSACHMLEMLDYNEAAIQLRLTIDDALAQHQTTKDLGGQLTTSEFADVIVRSLT